MQFLRNLSPTVLFCLLALCLASTLGVLIFSDQSSFNSLLCFYTIAFLAYLLIVSQKKIKVNYLYWCIGGAILIRFISIFIFPQLSDDIYRFIWDGKLLLAGYNPYTLLPSEALTLGIQELDQTLFDKLNSPDYFSVYPPITQLIFLSGSWTSNAFASSIIYKSLLFLAEVGSISLLYKICLSQSISPKRILLYILNPLIIIEIMGNIHFEGFMIFTILLSWWYLYKKKNILAASLISIGTGLKLIPLLFTPIYWAYTKLNRTLFIATALFCLMIFVPVLFGSSITKFGSSVDLYFGKFEFNASIYYLLRWLGEMITGYNLIRYIGILPLIALIIVNAKYLFSKEIMQRGIEPIANAVLLCYSLYLFTTTTVHPWYLSTLILCSVFSSLRYAVVWSGVIILSYSHYENALFVENYGLITIEYLAVFSILFYEYYIQKKRFINL